MTGSIVLMCLGILLFCAGVGWYYWPTDSHQNTSAPTQPDSQVAHAIKQEANDLGPIIQALKRSQDDVANKEQSLDAVKHILSQYDQLMNGISTFEQMTGTPNVKDRLASAEHILNDLKLSLGAVEVRQNGGLLIIKTGQNTFRVTFAVPMRIAPAITIPTPPGVTANITEKSNIGFTVQFTPLSIPIEHFP